jgi:hypothetical protein
MLQLTQHVLELKQQSAKYHPSICIVVNLILEIAEYVLRLLRHCNLQLTTHSTS